MSDTRRRRKSQQSGGSDDLSDSYDDLNATKETQSSEQTDAHQDSEYDTVGSDSETESQDGALRESGDGQEEEKPQRKLDDDEDRRNPQYIPKRGTFYEHDDRTAEETNDAPVETQNEREGKEKKVWKDKEDRWDHDRYNDDEQAPKSHEELIAVYGYDIRNEEGPPRARRRRRYGRGPNKYTRNWEDEDAYGKTSGTGVSSAKGPGRKTNRSGEEFPALNSSSKEAPNSPEEPVISSAWYSSKNKQHNKSQNFPPLQTQPESQKPKTTPTSVRTNENKPPNATASNTAWKKDNRNSSQIQTSSGDKGGGDADKVIGTRASSKDSGKRQESASLAASRARGRGFKINSSNNSNGGRIIESKPKGRGAGPIAADNRRDNAYHHDDEHRVGGEIKQHSNVGDDNMNFHQPGRQNKYYHNQVTTQQKPNVVPPRMQQQQQQQQQHAQSPVQEQPDAAGNRPKRYSSLRQRPAVAEGPGHQTYQPQPAAQHGYFSPQAGNSRGVIEAPGYPPGHFEQAAAVGAPAAPATGQPPVIPLASGQPANFAAPPSFLLPAPQFMAAQPPPPTILNYVPGPNGPAFQPSFQPGYPGYTPTVQPPGPPPPQELYQPQGCTYYSPQQQQQQQQQGQQTAPLRRPKAAIPILPPPDNQRQGRGKGQTIRQQNGQSIGSNSSREDVTDSKVEPPEEVQHAADESEQPNESTPNESASPENPITDTNTSDVVSEAAKEAPVEVETQKIEVPNEEANDSPARPVESEETCAAKIEPDRDTVTYETTTVEKTATATETETETAVPTDSTINETQVHEGHAVEEAAA